MNKKTGIILAIVISGIVVGSGLGVGLFFILNKPTQLFIAIHCEPGSYPLTTTYQETNWPYLVAMVAQADANDVKLTILMNPQWGTYILQNISRLNQLRAWEMNGHEIGMHVHGPSMSTWCGYTNNELYTSNPDYIGTIDDMMDLMNQLPASGQIKTTCSTDADIGTDYPEGVPYSTQGGSDKMEHLWSRPSSMIFAGLNTIRVTHARYDNVQSEINIDIDEFKTLYQPRNRDYVMGVVWHVFNYADNPLGFIQLFEYLNSKGITTLTVDQICV